MLRRFVLIFLSLSLGLAACSDTSVEHDNVKPSQPSQDEGFSYPVPLADFSDAAEQLFSLSPQGIAIGEVHGQIAGVVMLEAMATAALAQGKAVLILHEFTPSEAGLDLSDVLIDDFHTIYMTSKTLPFWTDNNDKRATWELQAFFQRVENLPNVELSYLWDSRLNPPPNRLKAHGMAERWKIAKEAKPDSYIIALAGNYHTQVKTDYPLEATNSLCRYTEEKYGFRPTCISVDRWLSPNENCQENQVAKLVKGDIFSAWDYAVLRPDRCVVQAHWVNAPQ